MKDVPKMPGSLDEALVCLEKNHEFLLKGGAFSKEVLETWIEYKREKEVDAMRLRPHPKEFELYYDCESRRMISATAPLGAIRVGPWCVWGRCAYARSS